MARKKYVFFFLFLVVQLRDSPSRAGVRSSCLKKPDCPVNTPFICRRPCSQGYIYEYGGDCSDHFEPVAGSCARKRFVEGKGGWARMKPGARRPGEVDYAEEFTVTWFCGAGPAQDFTLRYSRTPRDPGTDAQRREDSRLTGSLEAFLKEVDVRRTDPTVCFEQLREQLRDRFSRSCRIVEEAAGTPSQVAAEKCRAGVDAKDGNDGEITEKKLSALRSILMSKQLEAAQSEAIPAILPMHETRKFEERSRQRALRYLSIDCFGLDRGYNDPRIPLSKEFMLSELPKLAAQSSEECKRFVFSFYADRIAEAHHFRSTEAQAASRQAIGALRAAFPSYFHEKSASRSRAGVSHEDCSQCQVPDPSANIELRDIVLDFIYADACVSLPVQNPPASRIVKSSRDPLRLPGSYRLTRLSEKAYRVELNLNFSPPSLNAKWQGFTNACFARAKPWLRNSRGETLECRLANDPRIPVSAIRIISNEKDFRSNREEWNENIECPSILHESLHEMGLVDLYKEAARGYVYNAKTNELKYYEKRPSRLKAHERSASLYDCRVLGPSDSIMSHEEDAFAAVEGWWKKRDSLLYDSEFDVITRPGCLGPNRLYYDCAAYAYQTSKKRFGKGCQGEAALRCKDGEWIKGKR